MKAFMEIFEQLLKPKNPLPRPLLKEKIWEKVENNYQVSSSNFFVRWRYWLTSGAIALGVGLLVVSKLVSHQQTQTQLYTLNSDLTSLEQEITQDPVITEALESTH